MNKDLVNRLRGIYIIPVNDGAGLLDGKDTFTRVFDTSPIQHEAANEIERLNTRIVVLEGVLRNIVRLENQGESVATSKEDSLP